MSRTNASKKRTPAKPATVAPKPGENPKRTRIRTTPRVEVERSQKLSDLWELRSAKLDGKNVATTQLKGARLHFTYRGHFVVTVGNQVLWSGEARFRPDEGPRAIDIVHSGGEFAGAVFRAIYEVDGDTHRICSAPPGGQRPSAFESRRGAGHMLQVWRRESRK